MSWLEVEETFHPNFKPDSWESSWYFARCYDMWPSPELEYFQKVLQLLERYDLAACLVLQSCLLWLASCVAVSQEDTCSFLDKLYTTEFRVEELLYTLKILYRDTVAEDWKTIVKHRLNQSFIIIRTSETLLLYAQNLHKYGLSRNGK